jgi:hypothetical protein
VESVEILGGPEPLHATVRRALREWTFTPARLNGREIATYRVVRVPFRLHNVSRS